MTYDPEYSREWYKKNKEKVRQNGIDYRKNNSEKEKARCKKYYENHKEQALAKSALRNDSRKEYFMRYAKEHAEEARERNRLWQKTAKYGITIDQYNAMLESQDYKCAICHKDLVPGTKTHIDHSHTPFRIRGILCNKCNMGIGLFEDNATFLLSAVVYLQGFYDLRMPDEQII
jgi:hypothetical protein